VLTDQDGPFLGHGHHYDVASCPHYKADQAPWMDDLIHPNAAGHENLFQQWEGDGRPAVSMKFAARRFR
jgi:hypothetical protein